MLLGACNGPGKPEETNQAKPAETSAAQCPGGSGATSAPFYDVSAAERDVPGRGSGKSLIVRGTYRTDEPNGVLVLHEVHYGAQSHLLEADLRRNAGPAIHDPCVHFGGSFDRPDATQLKIVDAKGNSISLPVER